MDLVQGVKYTLLREGKLQLLSDALETYKLSYITADNMGG